VFDPRNETYIPYCPTIDDFGLSAYLFLSAEEYDFLAD
jgi:hypothetical protein